MNTSHRTSLFLLIAILLTIGGLLDGVGTTIAAAAAPTESAAKLVVEPTPPAAPLTLINASTKDVDLVDEAIAQFDAAGLTLPPVEIEFFKDSKGCKGHEGIHQPAQRGQVAVADRIVICNRMKIILLHELAHAWKHHNLSEETRVQFTQHWELENWNDKSDAWGDRGVERAAHTIAFTLNQQDPNVSDGVRRYVCGYELLTGRTTAIHSDVAC